MNSLEKKIKYQTKIFAKFGGKNDINPASILFTLQK